MSESAHRLGGVRTTVATLALLASALAVAGCGSSLSHAEKQTRIRNALRKLDAEIVASEHQTLRSEPGVDVLGRMTLFYAPKPPGVTDAEWKDATRRDTTLRRFERHQDNSAAQAPAKQK
jgi:hypothetical protein